MRRGETAVGQVSPVLKASIVSGAEQRRLLMVSVNDLVDPVLVVAVRAPSP